MTSCTIVPAVKLYKLNRFKSMECKILKHTLINTLLFLFEWVGRWLWIKAGKNFP